MRGWRKGFAVVGVALVIIALYWGPYLASYQAAHQATAAAISAAEAKQNTAQAKQELTNLNTAEQNIKTLLTEQHQLSESNSQILNNQIAAYKAKVASDQTIINEAVAAIEKLAAKCEAAPPCTPGNIALSAS